MYELENDNPATLVNLGFAHGEYNDGHHKVRIDAESNPVTVRMIDARLKIVKYADRETVRYGGDAVTFTLHVVNTGNVPVEHVTVTDILPRGLRYVRCSTTVDGHHPADKDPAHGVDIGLLIPGGSCDVSFKAAPCVRLS